MCVCLSLCVAKNLANRCFTLQLLIGPEKVYDYFKGRVHSPLQEKNPTTPLQYKIVLLFLLETKIKSGWSTFASLHSIALRGLCL